MNTTLIAPDTEGTVLDTGTTTSIEQRAMDFFNSRMAGQMEAKRAAAAAIRRSVSKLRNKKRPIRTLVFLGPSTTGKTLLASLIAEFLHNDPEALLFLDGSNYMERHQLVGLVGAPKSYIGYVDPKDPKYVPPKEDEVDPYAELSQHNLNLSRKGSKCPTIVILVDEWEKACREFNNVMLRITRNGKIKLGNGSETTFYNVILVVTGNIGTRAIEDLKNPMGFGHGGKPSKKDIDQAVMHHLKEFAPPEFRKRVIENGEFIIFEQLTDKQLSEITDQQVEQLKALMQDNGEVLVQLDVDTAARKWLLSEALKDEGDVANLSGIIESKLTYPLDGQMIEGKVESGDRLAVTHEEGKDELTIRLHKSAMLLGQANGEIDPALVAAIEKSKTGGKGPGGNLREAQVDVESVRRALVPLKGGQGDPTDGAGKPGNTSESTSEGSVNVIVQDFVLTVRAQTREQIAEARQQTFAELVNAPYVDVTDESYSYDKPTMVQIQGGMMSATLSIMQLKVVGPIESLLKVKRALPFVSVDVVAGPLE